MKRALQLMLALAMVSMFMISPVAAATSEGLDWGIVVGDRFDFTWTVYNGTTVSDTEAFYLNVTAVADDPIPDPLTDWNDLSYHDIGAFWANDTDMGLSVLVFFGLMFTGTSFAVPIGNFDLCQELVGAKATGETFTNDATTFGLSVAYDLTPTEEMIITANYAKADGFLKEYVMSTESSANDTVFGSFNIERVGGTLDIVGLLQDNIIIVAAAVGVLIVVLIICKKK